MPNHVEGLIQIIGKEQDLKDLKEFVKDGDSVISANRVIPYPDKSKKKDEFAQDTWVVDVKMIVTNTQLAHLALNTKDHVFLMIVEGR